ncbi:NCS1 family nucleobase:cation symporter-1 [Phenylobacterium sp.]|uniref:NCS1 family nucleobase:cation symporter-1 n=1 Tax=Phenylobacterium sp. TaxID=1871053 RepID=UPI00301CEBE2
MTAIVSDLNNPDLAPTTPEQRTWRWWHFAALWVGMTMCIPAYLLASGLIDQGMSPGQAVFTVLLGNVIVLIPMLLIGHAGARHGIPYAVLARASFGVEGGKLPAIARAIVACGWYGIQTWVGGTVLLALAGVALGAPLDGPPLPGLGISAWQFAAFLTFWAIQLFFVTKGMEMVKRLETWTAPAKILICAVLVAWALGQTGGLAHAFDESGRPGAFAAIFWPSLTAMVGFWATLALNIPDFTRFARTQRDQFVGQAVGLPLPMGALAAVAVITTAATRIAFGEAIWDPVELATRFPSVWVLIGLLIISIDTISCNIAANLVGPAYDFSALSPRRISYRTGAWITALIGVCIMPWKLVASSSGYIFTWLIGYSALLGPIAGIIIADYWLLRRAELDAEGLYAPDGPYAYRRGWNPAAVIALVVATAPNLPGFLMAVAPGAFGGLPPAWAALYPYAWFVGVAIALVVYYGLMRWRPRPAVPA